MAEIQYFWDDFEDDVADQNWVAVCHDGRRVLFHSDDDGFPVNTADYSIDDETEFVDDLKKHYPSHEIVRRR